MSQDSLQTGSIDRFQLTASIGSNSVDLSAGVSEFRLYESVLSNTVTATAIVVETGTGVKGSIDGLPIRGGENLSLKINPSESEPEIIYKDEIMYALGNIIQNAIFYSKHTTKVELKYEKTNIKITISDDGNGFSKDIIDKLGEPYVSKNNQGMGLGIFIAKNLIENMGGNLDFYNSKEDNAVVEINFDNSILNI